MFFPQFSHERFSALKDGFSSLISFLSASLPLLLMQKYIFGAAIKIDQYKEQAEIWGIICRLSQIVVGIPMAFSDGSLNLIAYAFGAKNYRRNYSCFGFMFCN